MFKLKNYISKEVKTDSIKYLLINGMLQSKLFIYENGNLRYTADYKDGKKHGKEVLYNAGKVVKKIAEAYYTSGRRNNRECFFYVNDTSISIVTYNLDMIN